MTSWEFLFLGIATTVGIEIAFPRWRWWQKLIAVVAMPVTYLGIALVTHALGVPIYLEAVK